MMPLSLALSALLAASAVETAAASSLETVQAREQVNFDFAWYGGCRVSLLLFARAAQPCDQVVGSARHLVRRPA